MPVDQRSGMPAAALVAALAVRFDLLPHRRRDEVLPLAEPHHVGTSYSGNRRTEAGRGCRPRRDLRQRSISTTPAAARSFAREPLAQLAGAGRAVGLDVARRPTSQHGSSCSHTCCGPSHSSTWTNVTFAPSGGPKQSRPARPRRRGGSPSRRRELLAGPDRTRSSTASAKLLPRQRSCAQRVLDHRDDASSDRPRSRLLRPPAAPPSRAPARLLGGCGACRASSTSSRASAAPRAPRGRPPA